MQPSSAGYSASYCIFCRVISAALILLGLAWIAVSHRDTTLTCQRSDGQCTISHSGILPDPGTAFKLDQVKRVRIAESSHNSGDPVDYQLVISTNPDQELPVTYAWEKDPAVLNPVLDQINLFLNDPGIPALAIRMPDPRSLDQIDGIFLVILGIGTAAINWRAVLTRSAGRAAPQPEPLSGAQVQVGFERKHHRRDYLLFWLWWLFAPELMFAIGFYLIVHLNDFISTALQASNWYSPLLIIISPIFLAPFSFGVQAWALRHYKMNGVSWIIRSSMALLIMIGLIILWVILAFRNDFGAGSATSQGSNGFVGIIIGLLFGVLQQPVLGKRLAHSGWWILGTAIAGMCMFFIPEVALYLITRFVAIPNEILANYSGNHYDVWVWMFVYSAITGAELIWLFRISEPAHHLTSD
jgi:hypothetical protein